MAPAQEQEAAAIWEEVQAYGMHKITDFAIENVLVAPGVQPCAEVVGVPQAQPPLALAAADGEVPALPPQLPMATPAAAVGALGPHLPQLQSAPLAATAGTVQPATAVTGAAGVQLPSSWVLTPEVPNASHVG